MGVECEELARTQNICQSGFPESHHSRPGSLKDSEQQLVNHTGLCGQKDLFPGGGFPRCSMI